MTEDFETIMQRYAGETCRCDGDYGIESLSEWTGTDLLSLVTLIDDELTARAFRAVTYEHEPSQEEEESHV